MHTTNLAQVPTEQLGSYPTGIKLVVPVGIGKLGGRPVPSSRCITQDEFNDRVARADKVQVLTHQTSSPTRQGVYVRVATGLLHDTWFVGVGRDTPDGTWRCMIEDCN